MQHLFAQPGQVPANIKNVLVSEGNRDEDECVFSPDIGPNEWAEAIRLTSGLSRR